MTNTLEPDWTETLVESIREMFDHIYLNTHISDAIKNTLQVTWLEEFANILKRNKQNWLFRTYVPLHDLTKLSFLVYQSLHHLPIIKKIELPQESWNYKWV